jgi:hypothetical protein
MENGKLREAIQRVVEGDEPAADPEIHIEPPREAEVNPAVYKDVESLLFRGFLVIQATINGVPFVFKSMNHHEYEYLQWTQGGISGRRAVEQYYNAFLAYGVFLVDGVNVLNRRDRWVKQLTQTFTNFPLTAKTKIVRYLSEVNRKASNAVVLTEAYASEQTSRFRWAQVRGLDLMGTACTGISGTTSLGMNYGQLTWRALNHFDDVREEAERNWDHAKFIGSCFAGKEIQKIYRQDKDRRQKEREQRTERRDRLIRQVYLGEDADSPNDPAKPIKFIARTVDELAQQLTRDLKGEKDWHDNVVALEEKRVRDQISERRRRIQEMAASKQSDYPQSTTAHADLSGLSAEEVRYRIERGRQLEAQRAASQIIYPELTDPRLEEFYRKYGMDEEDATYQPGAVRTSIGKTSRDPSEVQALPQPRPRATPFRR